MESKSKDALLELLKCALFGKPMNMNCFKNGNWNEIYRLANEQAVLPLCLEGINHLPHELMPSEESNRLKWITAMMKMEQRNKIQNEKVTLLINEFRMVGLHPILMKGQSLATEYSNPLHRTCGDIDLFFKGKDEVEKAIEWANGNGDCTEEQHEHDYPFIWNGEVVELHYWMALLYNKRYNRILQDIIEYEYNHEKINIVSINGIEIETIPETLYVLYQMIHISFHFLNEGIGLRQFCDLALYMNNHHAEIDFQKLIKWISDLDLKQLADLYATFMCKKLGLDVSIVPWNTESPYLDILYDDIFLGGNFGKLRFGFKGRSSFLMQKLKALPLHWKNYKRYHILWPKETTASFMSKWKRAALGIK